MGPLIVMASVLDHLKAFNSLIIDGEDSVTPTRGLSIGLGLEIALSSSVVSCSSLCGVQVPTPASPEGGITIIRQL